MTSLDSPPDETNASVDRAIRDQANRLLVAMAGMHLGVIQDGCDKCHSNAGSLCTLCNKYQPRG